MTLRHRSTRLLALAISISAPSLALAQDVTAGGLVIQHPWARATPGGAQVAGGYMTIVNHGPSPDTLTGGSSEASAKFELHTMAMENGIMTMRPTGPLTIAPGASVTMSPTGLHIMLTGLKHGLKKGDVVTGTLTFEHAGTVPVRFQVEGLGAQGPSAAPDKRATMPGMDMR